jgi:lipid A 3-O-deacylase
MIRILALTLLGAFAGTSVAGGLTVEAGKYGHNSRAAVGYEADAVFTRGGFTISPIFEVAAVRVHGDTVSQVSAVPMLRYTFPVGVYIEGGIGASLFSDTSVGDKQISTAFQFSDNVGLGYRFSGGSAIGYRFTHFSNADIKRPNPGINVQQVVFTVPF